jgi:hypothetical protein
VRVVQFYAQVRVLGAGNDKVNYSVMLCASAAGQKLPAAVVLARTRPLTGVEDENRRHLKLYYTGAGGSTWFTETVTLKWLNDNFHVSSCVWIVFVCLIHYFVLGITVWPSKVDHLGSLQSAPHTCRSRAWPHQ